MNLQLEEKKRRQGRRYDAKKKKEVITLELTDNNKVKSFYHRSIKDYSAKSLIPMFEEHISSSAKIITDKW